MAPPSLTRKLALQAPLRSPDGAGGYVVSWQTLGTLWAEIDAGRGRELTLATVDAARLPVTITVRAAPDGDSRRPLPSQRFVEGDRVYRILSVQPADRGRRYLACRAEEEVLS